MFERLLRRREQQRVIEGVQRELGRRIVRVESAVTALTERIAELEKDNRRLRGTASVEGLRVDRLQRGMKIPNTRSGASMTHEEIEDLVTRRVAEEMEAREAAMNLEPLNESGDEQEGGNGNGNGNGGNRENGNGNRNGNHGMNYGSFMPVARECTFQDFLKCKPHNFSGTEGVAGLMRLMIEVYCPRNEIQKMETELWNLTVKGNDLTAYTQRFQELILLCTRMVPDEEDRVERSAENKRMMESNPRDNRGQQPLFKRRNVSGQNVARAYAARNNENIGELDTRREIADLQLLFQTRKEPHLGISKAIGRGGTNPDSNVVMGTFLLNNCYASMLFDSGADRSFVPSTFSALLDVTPSTLDTIYAVELADGRISEINVVLR
ncbi:putative reverse transcriptase domain-containing protein, partial [Tanacetum coccineum]